MEAPPIRCSTAEVGVMVVHGIGNQQHGETKNKYGRAIADVWDQFGGRNESFGSSYCEHGHIHLTRADGSHAALVEEGRWNQVDPEPPPVLKLLLWMLVVTPWALMYSALKGPRGGFRSWNPWPLIVWFLRFALLPLLLPIVLVVMLVVVPVLGTIYLAQTRSVAAEADPEREPRLCEKLLGMAGDAYRFTHAKESATKYADAVATQAQHVAAHSDRLLVVAHSQGGAVSYDAITGANPSGVGSRAAQWPRTRTQVFTLGSGHNRLMMLRRMILTPFRSSFVALGAIAITISTTINLAIVVTDSDSTLGDNLAWITAGVAGTILLVFASRNGRHVGRTLRDRGVNWTDVWASRDLVPDGPVPFSGMASIEVTNTHSFIGDHTTYDKNPVQVIARVVDAIDPRRLVHDRAVVHQMQAVRHRRYRRGSIVRSSATLGLLGVVQPVLKRHVVAETQGRVSTLSRPERGWSRFVPSLTSQSSVVHF